MWTRYLLYFVYVPYLAYMVGNKLIALIEMPVFRPGNVTAEECRTAHAQTDLAMIKFLTIN